MAETSAYAKPVALAASAHKGLRVKQNGNAKHLKDNHIVKVYVSEYAIAGAEYPILFVKDTNSQALSSVAVWSIEHGKNVFVKNDNWIGGYIPASVRCLPFTMTIHPQNPDRLFIGIYEDSPLLSKDEGELIFNEDGSETEWMKQSSEFLAQVYHTEQHTLTFINKLDSLGLLTPQSLTIKAADTGEEKRIDGFFIVDRAKLDQLSDQEFLDLRKSDELEPIYAHLASLENINKVANKA